MSRGLPEGVFNDAYVICALIYFIKAYIVDSPLNYLDKFIKVYVVDTHLNCMDKSMQFKWVPTTYAIIFSLDMNFFLYPATL